MGLHSSEIRNLATNLLDKDLFNALSDLVTFDSFSMHTLEELDAQLRGPSLLTINHDGTGNYDIADREIFRPLQYCRIFFIKGINDGDLEWQARDIVEMSCLHIEALIKRLTGFHRLSLGALLRKPSAKSKLDPEIHEMSCSFARIYNDAKHEMSHDKDTHLFSISDAIFAYFISRALGNSMYDLVRIETDISRFD